MTDQKPSTPPAGPSGVSRPQDNHDVQQALRRVNDVIGGALRQIAAITGQPDPAPPTAPAPNHLDAMREAWGEGYYEGHANGRRKYDGDVENPYAKLLDDRREFVREQVNNGYGAQLDENDDDVLGDDNAEWFDAVLDAHDEWRALQRHTEPQPADTWRDDVVNVRIRAEQAEARVAEINSVLQQLLITVSPGRAADVRHEDMVDDVRTVLERAGYGTQPADGQYGVARDAEAVTDADPLPGCTSTHALGIAVYTCTRPAGHDAFHQDKRYGVAWAADGSSSWRVK